MDLPDDIQSKERIQERREQLRAAFQTAGAEEGYQRLINDAKKLVFENGADPDSRIGGHIINEILHQQITSFIEDVERATSDQNSTSREQDSQRTWEHGDLFEFSPNEFEELIASLYSSRGYWTRVTQQTRDKGVDIWAERGEERVGIEVKRHEEGSIGRPEVERLTSSIAEENADRVIFVATSTFAETAERYVRKQFDSEVKLINEEKVIKLLNQSNLIPPY